MLLKVVRHLRPSPAYKVIISREEGEGNFLQGYRGHYLSLKTTSHPGPLALVDGETNEQELELVARLVARYSQGRSAEQVTLEIREKEGVPRAITVAPRQPHAIPQEWYI